MSDYLDRLEGQLVRAASAARPSPDRRAARRRTIPASAAAALCALLAASAVALAVTGTFSTGSAVRPPERPVPTAGTGVATTGTRLLGIRAADPAGGPPWGLRVVHTTRRLVCLQLGRIQDGDLGVLGEDGAFGDDGRFHPVAPDVVGYHRETTELSTCLTPGQTTSLEARIAQSGVYGSSDARSVPESARRWISYGLLGPDAVSVRYTSDGRTRTIPVEPGTGAYLLVLPGAAKRGFETGGGAFSTTRFISPVGAISSIAYRVNGRLCSESRPASEAAAAHPGCPRPLNGARRTVPGRLNRPIHVRLSADGTATVTFTAPYAVTSALSDYKVQVSSPCHKGIDGTPLERDVRAGQLVRVAVPEIFANACGPTVPVQVVYEKGRNRFAAGNSEVIVGEATVRR